MFLSKIQSSNRKNRKTANSIAFSAILIGVLLLLNGNSAAAQNAIVPIGDVMDGCVIEWYWDDSDSSLTGGIDSQIVITNVTDGIIEGKIVAENSNYTLTMYDEESVIKAQFGYDSGLKGNWYIAARPSDGLFSFEIPAQYADADYVKIWVNSNAFVMHPPDEVQAAEDESTEIAEAQVENSTSTVVASNSTVITTTISTITSTDSTTNSTVITTTKTITIEPVNATESTNSTTTIITTVTTTTVTPAETTTTTTTDTQIVNASAEEEPEEVEISYVIGGNMTLHNISVEVPTDQEFWLADNVTMFFEEGYFMLDKRPMLYNTYEDYEDFESNKKAQYYEHYQTQIRVDVSDAMLKYEFSNLDEA